jgi:hypothetical protein
VPPPHRVVILHQIKDEEELLQSEFGAEYTDIVAESMRLRNHAALPHFSRRPRPRGLLNQV